LLKVALNTKNQIKSNPISQKITKYIWIYLYIEANDFRRHYNEVNIHDSTNLVVSWGLRMAWFFNIIISWLYREVTYPFVTLLPDNDEDDSLMTTGTFMKIIFKPMLVNFLLFHMNSFYVQVHYAILSQKLWKNHKIQNNWILYFLVNLKLWCVLFMMWHDNLAQIVPLCWYLLTFSTTKILLKETTKLLAESRRITEQSKE
jgi:hypothetical protein